MITKMPVRIARTLSLMNFPGSKINISQSLIEKNQLFQIVENEIMFEAFSINNNHQNSELTKLNGFKIIDIESEQRIELSKNVENIQILICIDFQNRDQSIEKEIIDTQLIHIQNTSETPLTLFQSIPQFQVPFSVYLSKGNGIISCYECLAQNNGKIKIQMISIIDDLEEHKLIPRECRGLQDYNGSNHIEDSIQHEMLNYLKTFEIDSKLALFVQHVQMNKEQVLNVNYLQDQQK